MLLRKRVEKLEQQTDHGRPEFVWRDANASDAEIDARAAAVRDRGNHPIIIGWMGEEAP